MFEISRSSTGSPKDFFLEKVDSPKDFNDDKNASVDEKDGYNCSTILKSNENGQTQYFVFIVIFNFLSQDKRFRWAYRGTV